MRFTSENIQKFVSILIVKTFLLLRSTFSICYFQTWSVSDKRNILPKSNWAHAQKLIGTALWDWIRTRSGTFPDIEIISFWWLNIAFYRKQLPCSNPQRLPQVGDILSSPRYVFVNLKRPFINLTIFQGCQIKQPLPIPVYQLDSIKAVYFDCSGDNNRI